MNNLQIKKNSPLQLAIVLTLAAVSQLSFDFLRRNLVLAQASFPLPTAVPSGTNVQIDGSTAMGVINQGLQERFKQKFAGTDVKIADNGTDAAIKELIDGKLDLVAVGRPLTSEEKAQGLMLVPLARPKIAIVVGADNPFKKSLTSAQFVKIFRGEISDWSQVGGKPGAIRLIDRPSTSETRQAFSRYSIFQKAEFKTGSNAVPVSSDRTEDIAKELGTDGISYAIVDNVADKPGIRAVLLHDTPPSDRRYPFSIPLGYVYKGPNPSEPAKAFLGYAIAPENQDIIAKAGFAEGLGSQNTSPEGSPTTLTTASPGTSSEGSPTTLTTASPGTSSEGSTTSTASPETAYVPPGAADSGGETAPFPWWWLLLPLLGIPLLLWLLKGKKPAATPVAAVAPVAPVPPVPPVAPVPVSETSRIILTPRDCQNAYAYWEVPSQQKEELKRQGGRKLALRLYDVTDIPDMDRQTPHSTKQFDCDENLQDLHLPVAVDNRDYLVELGYETSNGEWLRLARSKHIRVPACDTTFGSTGTGTPTKLQASSPTKLQTSSPTKLQDSPTKLQDSPTKLQDSATTLQNNVLATGAAMTAGAAAAAGSFLGFGDREAEAKSRIILVPRNCKEAYAYWEVADEEKEVLRQQGGTRLMLRVYESTNESESSHIQQLECNEQDWDRHMAIPVDNLDYVSELGYLTNDGTWLSLVKSLPVRVPACET
jgi:phosphate transport system substrate-binding protein